MTTWHSHPNCSRFGGPTEDGQGLAGSRKALGESINCKTANARGIFYFACCAESPTAKGSSNALLPAELKSLEYGDRLHFRFKGSDGVYRYADGIYMDFGPNISTKRYLDLGWPLAQALKFPGTGTVEWALYTEEGTDVASAAPACKAALAQATARWPKRDKSSDGIMGDAAHQARVSDHNSGNAFDLTEDKAHGVDCGKIILEVIKDKRCKYAIHDRRIWERSTGKWRAYTGSNPHTEHMHVSIYSERRGDTSPWPGIAAPAAPKPKPKAPPIVADPRPGAVYRLWHAGTQRHFYTANVVEANIVQDDLDYTYEGVGFVADPAKNTVPVVRFWRKDKGHIWTADPAEAARLRADKWTEEGPAWFASTAGTPVTRSRKGLDYLLSTTAQEGPRAGYTVEGIAFHLAT